MNLEEIYNILIDRGKTRIKFNNDGLHQHRIIPGYNGGKYSPDNITLLTRKEHKIIHHIRYKLFNTWQDLRSYKRLGGRLTDKEWHLCCIEGGKISGNKMKIEKRGVCGRTPEEMSYHGTLIRDKQLGMFSRTKEQHSKDSIKAGTSTYINKSGIFSLSKEQRKINAAKGGSIGGKKLSYYDRVKGVKGTFYINNGVKNKRVFSEIPIGWTKGKLPLKHPNLMGG